MRLQIIILTLILILACVKSIAQEASCVNVDFESGTFNGWTGKTGVCCPVDLTSDQIIDGRHTIMSGNATDPYTCGNVSVVAPGSTFSARLGNSEAGSQAESISYTLNVTSQSTLFIYKYAVVLEDPGHLEIEQPVFEVRVLNSSGVETIDPACTVYQVTAANGLIGFETCLNGEAVVRYKNWTTVGLNLEPYLGQEVTLQFATGDCSIGGHFGYAYVDAYCSPLEITANYCTGTESVQLTAPDGFVEYLWSNGETTQTINISNPVSGIGLSCQLVSVTGCVVDVNTTLIEANPIADFVVQESCFDHVQFENTSTIPAGLGIDNYVWDFGDGSASTAINPIHSYVSAGNYTVTLTVSNDGNCSASVSKVITVFEPASADLNYTSGIYCTADTLQYPTLSGLGNYTGGVFSAEPAGLALDAITGMINPSQSLAGTYTITYATPSPDSACESEDATIEIVIISNSAATIAYPQSVFCQSDAIQPVQITGFYPSGIFSASSGLAIDSITGAINPSLSTPGNYTITYSQAGSGSCVPVPAETSVSILSSPTAPDLSDGQICIDETGNVIRGFILNTGLDAAQYDFIWFLNGVEIPNSNLPVIDAISGGTYLLQITDNASGCSVNANALITVVEVPSEISVSGPQTFTDNEPIVVTVSGGSGNFYYQLNNGDVQEFNQFENPGPGIHEIIVTDQSECTNEVIIFTILDYPKFFTPNGDGRNDEWSVKHLEGFESAVIYIYDRYGKLLIKLSENEKWNGKYNGRDMPATDYWFVLEYQNSGDGNHKEKFVNHFSLKR